MAYLIVDGVDVSKYVNELKINEKANYNAQTNAAGDTVVDYINSKCTFEVGFIPLNNEDAIRIIGIVNKFSHTISYRNPATGVLKEDVNCILPDGGIEYYTIQANKVLFKAFTLTFYEL